MHIGAGHPWARVQSDGLVHWVFLGALQRQSQETTARARTTSCTGVIRGITSINAGNATGVQPASSRQAAGKQAACNRQAAGKQPAGSRQAAGKQPAASLCEAVSTGGQPVGLQPASVRPAPGTQPASNQQTAGTMLRARNRQEVGKQPACGRQATLGHPAGGDCAEAPSDEDLVDLSCCDEWELVDPESCKRPPQPSAPVKPAPPPGLEPTPARAHQLG